LIILALMLAACVHTATPIPQSVRQSGDYAMHLYDFNAITRRHQGGFVGPKHMPLFPPVTAKTYNALPTAIIELYCA